MKLCERVLLCARDGVFLHLQPHSRQLLGCLPTCNDPTRAIPTYVNIFSQLGWGRILGNWPAMETNKTNL